MSKNLSDLKPQWLEELQLKSWEPEILLSGIVLYGMFQLPDVLDQFLLFFSTQVYHGINAMETLVAILKIGVYWLILGLILHLICRGLWVGLIGLSYAFPEGIKHEQLKFRPKYMQKVQAVPPVEQVILKLERICSFIYSIAFLLFMSLVGTYIYAIVTMAIPIAIIITIVDINQHSNVIDWMQNYGEWMGFLGLLGVVDFLTMGYFRRFKIWGAIFWPFYRVFNALTLASYYRPTYFTIVTNLNRWWLFLFFVIFGVASFLGILSIRENKPNDYFSRIDIWSNQRGEIALEGFYQDKEEAQPSIRIQIASDVIEGNVLRVFIPVHIGLEDSIKRYMNYDSLVNAFPDSLSIGQKYLDLLPGFYRLSIADSTLETKFYFHQRAATNQKGYLTYLNIGHLPEGLYELEVRRPEKMYGNSEYAVVPFYKVE